MKILIVDDEPSVQEILTLNLGQYGACHVTDDGREAVTAVKRALNEKNPYQLICLNLKMPTMNSFQALAEIRSLEKAKGIRPVDRVKVLIISGTDDPNDVARAAYQEGNCNGYLTKPFGRKDLYAQLEKIGLASPGEEEDIFAND